MRDKKGAMVRIHPDQYERASQAAASCGQSLQSFVNEALEDILSGMESQSPILPRCIDKQRAHNRSAVVHEPVETAHPHFDESLWRNALESAWAHLVGSGANKRSQLKSDLQNLETLFQQPGEFMKRAKANKRLWPTLRDRINLGLELNKEKAPLAPNSLNQLRSKTAPKSSYQEQQAKALKEGKLPSRRICVE